jgi:DNA-binding YbaB/EbfC family protein
MQPGEIPNLEGFRERAEEMRDQLMPGLQAALAQAQEMQQKLMEAQAVLAASEVHGQAGGGLVQVTMKGSGEVSGVRIDPKVVDPGDVETLQDLIVGAIADAARQFAILAQTHLGPLAGQVPGAPGLPEA